MLLTLPILLTSYHSNPGIDFKTSIILLMFSDANDKDCTEAPLAYACHWVATPNYPYYTKLQKIFQRTNLIPRLRNG